MCSAVAITLAAPSWKGKQNDETLWDEHWSKPQGTWGSSEEDPCSVCSIPSGSLGTAPTEPYCDTTDHLASHGCHTGTAKRTLLPPQKIMQFMIFLWSTLLHSCLQHVSAFYIEPHQPRVDFSPFQPILPPGYLSLQNLSMLRNYSHRECLQSLTVYSKQHESSAYCHENKMYFSLVEWSEKNRSL